MKLNKQLKQLELSKFILANEIVFDYFDKKVSKDEYDSTLAQAIHIGVLALMEDRFSAFLSKTQNELGTELENLKRMFDLKQESFFTTTQKGNIAEEEIAAYMRQYFESKKIKDDVFTTGNEAGELPRNKTGDIIIDLDGSESKIAIECKLDKSIKLGDIASKDVFIKKADTAWSQLIESKANRNAGAAIIVFDRSIADKSIIDFAENVGFIPEVGFIVIIDSMRGDYDNLVIAYKLCKDIINNSRTEEVDYKTLDIIVKRLVRTIDEFKSIEKLVNINIDTNKKILMQMQKSQLLMSFNQKYLQKFLKEGALSKTDLLEFYMAEDIKDIYKPIEREIKEM